ncbi:hypothetical protein [Cellulomonas marina]|uniref:DoxX protein n=1 Tax=Cellulomonas marina TaxID=988821 RepID=A0A1I1AKE4_9CELL|nr:hypothetical protein [Cellulomonas marina]GIG30173.1 hypothetical protein Cma02nite_27730 [Cellulomonas marina]SFB38511.1 hypothetical protein SAMN05421867_11950 [Cellulomonas marina]
MTRPTDHLRPTTGPTAHRTAGRRVRRTLGATALLVALTALPASAHERWFSENQPGGEWSFFLRPLPLALTALVVVVALAWRWAARLLPRPELRVLAPVGRLTPYVPRLLAVHLGVSLLAFAVTGRFLAPSTHLDDVPGGAFAGVVEAAIGIWLISGVRLRAAALLVALLGPATAVTSGPVALLEAADVVGIAAFLAVLPPSDAAFGRVEADARRERWALLLLRLGVATALVTLAFSEKFTNPALARETLEQFPQLDVFALVGLQVPVDVFIVVAGTVELLFGALVLSGAIPQVAVLVAMVPFNATLLLFGTTEAIGHLPVYGVFLTLLAYGSDPRTAAAVPWLPAPADLRAALSSGAAGLRGLRPATAARALVGATR